MAATRLNPSPLPAVVRLFCKRYNLRKTRSRSLGGIPGPLSLIDTSAIPDAVRKLTLITVPDGQ